MGRVGRRDRRGAGHCQPHGLGDRRHRRGGAHGHAMAERARDAALDPSHCCSLILPARRSSQNFQASLPSRAPARRSCRAASGRRAGRSRAAPPTRPHDEARRGLVAAAHQHHAVDRMARTLLDLHGEEVAVEHRRRLHEAFGQRQRRHLHRKAARLETPRFTSSTRALKWSGRVEVGPGVEDADHRLARVVRRAVAHLHHPRAMAEAPEVVRREPARRAQSRGDFLRTAAPPRPAPPVRASPRSPRVAWSPASSA